MTLLLVFVYFVGLKNVSLSLLAIIKILIAGSSTMFSKFLCLIFFSFRSRRIKIPTALSTEETEDLHIAIWNILIVKPVYFFFDFPISAIRFLMCKQEPRRYVW